ncbi:GntR family transcriptional regulator [Saccharopolyspora taberi]|uniref:GntR family transcriptional regulator n=1 Tax=Saccharopolyspora taberi TaxID=60895 RepID=A0ABN3V4T0_9PSEU
MEPQATAVAAPVQLRIADDIRMRIERGDLTPGDPLPTLHELAHQWGCGVQTARSAINLLKQQGLITGSRGKAPVVRARPRQVVRSSNRHQDEKDRVLTGEDERGRNGVAENDLGVPIDALDFKATHEVVRADSELAEGFDIEQGAEVLRRVFELTDPKEGRREAWSVSYIPYDLVSAKPEVFESDKPHPGGTQHQLYEVAGIELARIDDEVTAAMPTTVTAQLWGMDPGIPMIRVRRISIDTHGRVVEISDADFPADRTKLHFSTPLALW